MTTFGQRDFNMDHPIQPRNTLNKGPNPNEKETLPHPNFKICPFYKNLPSYIRLIQEQK